MVFEHSDRKVILVIRIITVRGCRGQWGRKVLLPVQYYITNCLKDCSCDSDLLGPHPGRWIIRMAPSPMWDRKCLHWILTLPWAKHHILATFWLAVRYSILVCSPSGSLSSLSLCPFLMCFFFKTVLSSGDEILFTLLISWLRKSLCWILVCFEDCWFLQGLLCSLVMPHNYLVSF